MGEAAEGNVIPQHVKPLGFLMEYADSREEAEKNWHEDGDSFPLEMGETAILEGLKNEVIQSTPEIQRISVPLAQVA